LSPEKLNTKNSLSYRGEAQSGEFGFLGSVQEGFGSNNSEEAQHPHGQTEGNPQILERCIDIGRTVDHTIPLSEPPLTTDNFGEDSSNWSTDLRDWWNFPCVDFRFDYLS
jgi:hypothetical protein